MNNSTKGKNLKTDGKASLNLATGMSLMTLARAASMGRKGWESDDMTEGD